MQADHVAFGVLDERSKAILVDGEFLPHHFASMLGGASRFQGTIGLRERKNDRAAAAGVLLSDFTSIHRRKSCGSSGLN